ncbi:ABC transporter [Musa troglodytarum]|uniref:ABC transporter n=1 Tax=Musa troglodytarum TaxID=320322 RepID=A0A9E7GHR2_9LILI|nr:ABC transporter [Musa troglodytarum]
MEGGDIEVSSLNFAYEGQPPLFTRFNLAVSPGSRCLLVGANGSGKTTLLKILAGKHMVGGRDVVRVLNASAFHDTRLVCSGDLAYLGGSWSKTVGSAGDIPLQGDFSAEHMIFGVEGVDPARGEKLIDLLDINLQWRMHKVSDGQRRRVQICMGLLYPYKRGVIIVYATHIFDGLETWATHVAYIQDGDLKKSGKLSDIIELKSAYNLLSVVESWLRSEAKLPKKEPIKPISFVARSSTPSPFDSSPFRSSRHMAYYR